MEIEDQLLTPDGKTQPELCREDQLYLSAAGYKIRNAAVLLKLKRKNHQVPSTKHPIGLVPSPPFGNAVTDFSARESGVYAVGGM